jgi:hypothetical protein
MTTEPLESQGLFVGWRLMETVSLIDRLSQVEERYEELERLLADPQVAADDNQVRGYARSPRSGPRSPSWWRCRASSRR